MKVKWDVTKRGKTGLLANMTKYDKNGNLTKQIQEVTQVFNESSNKLLGEKTGDFYGLDAACYSEPGCSQDALNTQVKVTWTLVDGRFLYNVRTKPISPDKAANVKIEQSYKDLGAKNWREEAEVKSADGETIMKIYKFEYHSVDIKFSWEGELPWENENDKFKNLTKSFENQILQGHKITREGGGRKRKRKSKRRRKRKSKRRRKRKSKRRR